MSCGLQAKSGGNAVKWNASADLTGWLVLHFTFESARYAETPPQRKLRFKSSLDETRGAFYRHSKPSYCISGPSQNSGGHLPAVQTHSPPSLKQMPSRHPHIAQRKQRHQLRRVLGQPFIGTLVKPNWHLITRSGYPTLTLTLTLA
jgi:hypothetical protein